MKGFRRVKLGVSKKKKRKRKGMCKGGSKVGSGRQKKGDEGVRDEMGMVTCTKIAVGRDGAGDEIDGRLAGAGRLGA